MMAQFSTRAARKHCDIIFVLHYGNLPLSFVQRVQTKYSLSYNY